METVHKSVLLNEIQEFLTDKSFQSKKTLTIVDGTLGGSGHSTALADMFGQKLTLVGLDKDQTALDRGRTLLENKVHKLILENENFRYLDRVLQKHSIEQIDALLLDLGLSSDELDASGKGFSFQKEGPLLMTFGDPQDYPFTAKDIVNSWEENNIADIIYLYGEEKFSRRIARSIINYRQKKTIETSSELAEVVKTSLPSFVRRGKIHPATKTFQALRIAVNDELNSLKEGLDKGFEVLSKDGRMLIISFHSLEDRIVKDYFKKFNKKGGHILTKKPLVASEDEVSENPRSRSAKLRVLQKIK